MLWYIRAEQTHGQHGQTTYLVVEFDGEPVSRHPTKWEAQRALDQLYEAGGAAAQETNPAGRRVAPKRG